MNSNNSVIIQQPKRRKQTHNNNHHQYQQQTYKLSHLPLRPSTLSLLTRRGFHSTADVHSSKSSADGGGGISNFASELEISLVDAMNISQEIDNAIVSMGTTWTTAPPPPQNAVHSSTSQNEEGVQEQGSQTLNESSNNIRINGINRQRTQRNKPQTAAQILSSHYNNNSSSSSRPIISFVRSIDSLLGGGFHRKEIIEIAGVPGVGKTQLAMQVCVDAYLPKQFGGAEGESIYIDSEGSFSPERCHDMANALVNHVKSSATRRKAEIPESFNVDSILDSIHIFRVYDETCQTATIYSLPDFLRGMQSKGRDVKVLVIDSIAFHYRASTSTNYSSRTKSLTSIAAFLSDLANKFDLSVLIINQMTTKVGGGLGVVGGNTNSNADHESTAQNHINGSNVVAALGESWAHSTTSRILLMFDNVEYVSRHQKQQQHQQQQRRICKLVKSPHQASGLAYFSVTSFGLRDCIQS